MIRSAEQFTTMFNRLGRQGGTLRFAAGADLDLAGDPDRGIGPVSVRGRTGSQGGRGFGSELGRRPASAPADWTVMLSLRSGSLHLQGIDLVVPDQEIAAGR